MKVIPIKLPFNGEQVVGVSPELKTFTDENDWRRRLNNYTGRALTHTALRTEQAGRSGRIATLGQLVSPGVVTGLEADKAIKQISSTEQAMIVKIAPGSAVAASGEVITITHEVQATLRDIHVYAPVTVLSEDAGSSDSGSDSSTDESPSLSGLLARKLGPTLQKAIDDNLSLPPAAILLLQPIAAEMMFEQDDDPCELDPENYAYENWQLVDGARLVLYSWPEEVLPLPVQDETWRNRMANEIFSLEKNLAANEVLPWTEIGIPIALIGFDNAWDPLFLDRNAVVRAGGKRRRTPSVLPDVGNRFLWQARFEQFNEQLADIVSGATGEDVTIQAANAFRYLPAVGVLPKDFIDARSQQHDFFPLSYHVEAVPIPYEQLDVVIQDSAPLESFDFNRPERVQVMVPVPQVYYEPDLLRVEEIDPEFDETIERFVTVRNGWLGRRLELRRKASAINKAVTSEPLVFDTSDSDAVDELELAAPFETALVEVGDYWRYVPGTSEAPTGWQGKTFDDNAWISKPTSIGYGNVDNETVLDDMQGNYVSLFCRKTFTLTDVSQAKHYKLVITTNGGFFAYINGNVVASNNLSATAFNTIANTAIDPVAIEFDLEDLAGNLEDGDNVIAIQVHNHSLTSPFFTFIPRLIEKQYVDDIEDDDYTATVNINEQGTPLLDDNFEPVYVIEAIEALREYLDNSTTFLSDAEVAELDTLGIDKYIEFLQEKVDKANDKVDFGFLRLQTDIYRLRQFVVGNIAGSKLATSPVLAGIAQGETAAGTKEELNKFAEFIKTMPTEEALRTATVPTAPLTGSGGATTTKKTTNLFTSRELGGKAIPGAGVKAETGVIGVSGPVKGVTFVKDAETKKLLIDDGSKSGSELFLKESTTKIDIEEQAHIVGTFPDFRNVTVGERLAQSVAEEAITSGRAVKADTINAFADTGLSIGDIEVPGFKSDGSDVSMKIGDIDDNVLNDIKSGQHDPYDASDEASSFNASVRAMENSAATLRLIEGRIKAYKIAIEKCKSTATELRGILTRIDRRLKVVGDELAEARHDVTVSRALKEEEEGRISGINARRDAVIEEHVPFLVFRRPRLSDVRNNVPLYTLHPDLSDSPLPVCDVNEDEVPEEISAMMDVMREAPLKWFTISKSIFFRINRLADLRVLLKSAKGRATTKTSKHRLLTTQYDGLNKLAQGINKTLLASYQQVSLQRKQTALLDLAKFNRYGWNETVTRANEVISLGDVIDGNHGRMGAARIAAQELEGISRVAVCLYLHFTNVLPSIRLDWAERLSQFDAPFNLRNLFSLPRWSEIEYIERNEMQRLVDWLYQRIDAVYSDASDMVSDLVRICILLASHAPVNQIISGLVPEPTTIRVGSKINIVADLTRVRIGMNIAMVAGKKTVARGKVADIVGGQVSAQIVSTITASVSLEKNAKVQIGEPRTMGGTQYQQNKFLFMRGK
ncbi:MAG: hypothetical protein AMJ53_01075 [Gammaproteobacteria bacterium SG8_11]|nr:MAG: hypothetical protein AMJ53_01075 [Gammaproteobacteria bacterium SG8_11]